MIFRVKKDLLGIEVARLIGMMKMVKKLKVEFERGGEFVATLLEEDAPKTCEKVWDSLPVKTRVTHCQWSGQMFYSNPIVDKIFEIPENQFRALKPGNIGFNKNKLLFCYGPRMLHFSMEGIPNRSNLFAHIPEGNPKDLEKIGIRVLECGMEEVKLTKV